MLTFTSPDSLYRRIGFNYFGVGLICAFLLLGIGLIGRIRPDWAGPTWLVSASAVPLLLLWFGRLQLRKLLAAPEQILTQLARISEQPRVDRRTLIPVTDAQPAAAGWNHLLQDLQTGGVSDALERKLSAALQSGSESRMTDILNTLPDGVAVTDRNGRIQSGNRALWALLNVAESERDSSPSLMQLCQRLSHQPLTETISGPTRFELQRSEDPADGVYRIRGSVLVSDSEADDTLVWIVRDVTQQRLAEQMRTEFVETATHELRTPLANIRAYAETLQLADDISVEDQKEFINIINAESTRLGRFVDELLNLSQMDAGSITVSRHDTDFERLLQECIEHTRPQMDRKQQSFETQIPAKLPHLNLDKDKIASCLVNVLGNAAKYTPEGGRIRLVVEESPSELSIRVEDTGYGIAPEELTRVCSRFFRSADDRVRQESGSGLGLAYTQEILRLHGGRLTVDSELNQGSQFTLHLPL